MLESSVTGIITPPLLLVVYSAYDDYVMAHLKSFQRSIEEFQEVGLNASYGLVDLSEVAGKKGIL